jgi:uncharacterized membrane-anchored protein YhcB (DUF1043 family)
MVRDVRGTDPRRSEMTAASPALALILGLVIGVVCGAVVVLTPVRALQQELQGALAARTDAEMRERTAHEAASGRERDLIEPATQTERALQERIAPLSSQDAAVKAVSTRPPLPATSFRRASPHWRRSSRPYEKPRSPANAVSRSSSPRRPHSKRRPRSPSTN